VGLAAQTMANAAVVNTAIVAQNAGVLVEPVKPLAYLFLVCAARPTGAPSTMTLSHPPAHLKLSPTPALVAIMTVPRVPRLMAACGLDPLVTTPLLPVWVRGVPTHQTNATVCGNLLAVRAAITVVLLVLLLMAVCGRAPLVTTPRLPVWVLAVQTHQTNVTEEVFGNLLVVRAIITPVLLALLLMGVCGLEVLATTVLLPVTIRAVLTLLISVILALSLLLLTLPVAITLVPLVLLPMGACGLGVLVIIVPPLATVPVVQILLINAILLRITHLTFLLLLTTHPTLLTQRTLLTLPTLLLKVVITTAAAAAVYQTLPVCGTRTRILIVNRKSNAILRIAP